MRAIVAYSFGGSVGRPGPSNQTFGRIINSLTSGNEKFIVVVQDFIEHCVDRKPDLVTGRDGVYISTEDITDELAPFLRERGIREVLLVAHPFLHWRKCRNLLEDQDLAVERVKTGWIPFDEACENWWVRGPFHLLFYGVLQVLFGRHGH